jgi:hypothetical protein
LKSRTNILSIAFPVGQFHRFHSRPPSWWAKCTACNAFCPATHQLMRMCGATGTKMAAGYENGEYRSMVMSSSVDVFAKPYIHISRFLGTPDEKLHKNPQCAVAGVSRR